MLSQKKHESKRQKKERGTDCSNLLTYMVLQLIVLIGFANDVLTLPFLVSLFDLIEVFIIHFASGILCDPSLHSPPSPYLGFRSLHGVCACLTSLIITLSSHPIRFFFFERGVVIQHLYKEIRNASLV